MALEAFYEHPPNLIENLLQKEAYRVYSCPHSLNPKDMNQYAFTNILRLFEFQYY
jgi:hypothetical protein